MTIIDSYDKTNRYVNGRSCDFLWYSMEFAYHDPLCVRTLKACFICLAFRIGTTINFCQKTIQTFFHLQECI